MSETFLCRDCAGCCQVENDTIEADASLCPQRIRQKGPPFRNQTVALSWNCSSRYCICCKHLQTMKYCNPKTTNTNWKRLRIQFQTLQHEHDWAVADEWFPTNLRPSKPNAASTGATNSKKTMTTGCESCQTCNWRLEHSNFCTESMTKVMKNWELFVCLLAENGAGEWVSANTPLRSGWGLPTFAIDRTPRFECLHRCSTKQDPLSTGWLVKLNKGLNTNCVSISFRLIAETFISEFLSIDRSWSGSAFWASANGLSNQGLRLRSELTHQSSAKVKVSSLTFGNLVSKCSSDCKN